MHSTKEAIMVWVGDPEKRRVDTPERRELLKLRADIVQQITALRAKPLPHGDREQMQRFRTRDLTDLATKVVKIDQKLGRIK
jgi:hypothetical protein